ncbi:hypothetical protein RFZ47_07285, partial [Acinetobacter baumannii]|nr:hypothetical protein [Acinetobacter baumannii]
QCTSGPFAAYHTELCYIFRTPAHNRSSQPLPEGAGKTQASPRNTGLQSPDVPAGDQQWTNHHAEYSAAAAAHPNGRHE